jgi:hypothetical protein
VAEGIESVLKVVDHVADLLDRVSELTSSDVLIGVPATKGTRSDGGARVVTNAMLARVHEFGSPAHNIPARPFLRPAIKKVQPTILPMLKKAAQDIVMGQGVPVDVVLNKVGIIARNAAVEAITNPDPAFAPLQPATIRARMRKTAAGRRKLRSIMDGGKQMGMSSAQILRSYAGSTWDTGGAGLNIQPLIDTGQLRRSISYVVRKVQL